MNSLLILIGRTASGKDALARRLVERGLTRAISHTTRPPRDFTDTKHVFVENIDEYPDRIACTRINGFAYFLLPEDVRDADILVLDSMGTWELERSNVIARPYVVVHLCDSADIRAERFIAQDRGTLEDFRIREQSDSIKDQSFLSDVLDVQDNQDKVVYSLSNMRMDDIADVVITHWREHNNQPI